MSKSELLINEKYLKLVPRPSEDQEKALRKSIMIHRGCLETIKINKKSEILDGYSRFEICKQINLPFRTEIVDLPTEQDEMNYVIEVNLKRRHLLYSQIEKLEIELENLNVLVAQGKENIKAGKPLSEDQIRVDTLKTLSEKTGLSRDTVSKAKTVLEKGTPELKQQLKEGKTTINRAYQEVKEQTNEKPPTPTETATVRRYKDIPHIESFDNLLSSIVKLCDIVDSFENNEEALLTVECKMAINSLKAIRNNLIRKVNTSKIHHNHFDGTDGISQELHRPEKPLTNEELIDRIEKDTVWDMRFWDERTREQAEQWVVSIKNGEDEPKNCGHAQYCIRTLLRRGIAEKVIVDAIMRNEHITFENRIVKCGRGGFFGEQPHPCPKARAQGNYSNGLCDECKSPQRRTRQRHKSDVSTENK